MNLGLHMCAVLILTKARGYHRTAAVLCRLPVRQTPAQLTLRPAQRHRECISVLYLLIFYQQ